MQLIVFSGLPGAGKSTLAEATARALGIPVFAKDWLEGALKGAGLGGDRLGYAGYELLTTLATRQLTLGQSVILDSVASTASIRDQWRALANRYAARWRVVECICSDEVLHRQRLGGRRRDIPNWHELDWAEVERVRGYYAPWTEDRLVIDAVKPADESITAILAYLAPA